MITNSEIRDPPSSQQLIDQLSQMIRKESYSKEQLPRPKMKESKNLNSALSDPWRECALFSTLNPPKKVYRRELRATNPTTMGS